LIFRFLVVWQVASHLSLLIRPDFIPESFDQIASGGNSPRFLLCGCFFRRLSLQKCRAQAYGPSAAFEVAKYD
jgi:hypothetical protein